MQHGIESVKIMPDEPCFDENLQYNALPYQQFYLPEIRRKHRQCTKQGPNFEEMTNGPSLTEWDVHSESGVLNYVDQARSVTYSFWPSSEIKKDIPMKFYQKPAYNYKIECETSSEAHSLADFQEVFKTEAEPPASWMELLQLI